MTKRRPQEWLVLAALVALILGINVYSTFTFLTSIAPGQNDFLSRWEGARSYWVDGLSPYSDEASLNIQTWIYGREAVAGEDLSLFAYPFYTVFYVWPLVYLPYAWAAAIWIVLLEALLIIALLLLCDIMGWWPRPLLFTALVVWTLANYYAARGLLLGQLGHLVYCLQIVTLWAFYRGHSRLAGVALALSTIKPQMGILLIPLLGLWALRQRDWRFIAAFGVTGAALVGVSFVMLPGWLVGWLDQVRLYPTYTDVGSPIETLVEVLLGGSPLITQIISVALVGLVLYAWYTLLAQGRDERFLWVVVLSLVVTSTAAPRVSTPQYITFLVPIMLMSFTFIRHYNRRRAGWWMALVLLALLVLPWLHFLLMIEGNQEHISVYVPLPLIALAVMWLTRRLWWRHAPAFTGRTQSDESAVMGARLQGDVTS